MIGLPEDFGDFLTIGNFHLEPIAGETTIGKIALA
jgi:hypothetical protein